MTWNGESHRHLCSSKRVKTSARGFLSLDNPKRQTEYYPEYTINASSLNYIPEEDMEEIIKQIKNNELFIIHFLSTNGKMIFSNNGKRIVYQETIGSIPEVYDIETQNRFISDFILYGEMRKMKGYQDNIYRNYTVNSNNVTECKIEMIADVKKDVINNEEEYRKVLLEFDHQITFESLQAQKFVDKFSLEKWL